MIQNIDDDLLSILYWQSCYMSLQYFLIFSHDEQSWNVKISLQNHRVNENLLTRRINRNDISRHRMSFLNDDESLHEVSVVKNDDENEEIYEIDMRYDKEDSKRTTQIKFSRFLLQISQFVQIREVSRSLSLFYLSLVSLSSSSSIRSFFLLML